jgi:hypothetical protein
MIAIKRPKAPRSFTQANSKVRKKQAALIADFANRPDLRDGSVSATFDGSIWAGVKDVLLEAQFGKCAFCESSFSHISFGDVEHFRPKGGFQQETSSPLIKPGYWWLAYDWNNYWASCQTCNQVFKKNLFPIAPDGRRARAPNDKLSLEKHLMLDPMTDKISDHLEFREELLFAKNGSARGEATILVAGLNRAKLVEFRATIWRLLNALISARQRLLTAGLTTDAEDGDIRMTLGPQFQYSAMARDLIAREAPELLTP